MIGLLVAVSVVSLISGALLHAWAHRRSEARVNAFMERQVASRIARFPTGYVTQGGRRRVLP